eukprot:CAMPEP_0117489844 /NCGR_PEP_ID=MMETSP0784-20121206/17245_1 /TAXON_ID=39447 /ORGANISM="" /LENGTH=75 /DNA_ID=CAMNT_0005284585 /DNA_START=66 /DNA_END=289 /DNA_ORIENTATION=+
MDQRFPASLEHDFQQGLEPGFVNSINVTAIMVMIDSVQALYSEGVDVDDSLSLFLAVQRVLLVLLSVLAIPTVCL